MNDTADKPQHSKKMSRRRMLQVGAAATATLIVPRIALADDWIRVDGVGLTSSIPARPSIMRWRPNNPAPQPQFQTVRYTPMRSYSGEARSLSMYNVHTDERINLVYCEKGYYVPEALREVNYFFRDFRTRFIRRATPRNPSTSFRAIDRRKPTRCSRRSSKASLATVCISRAKPRTLICRDASFRCSSGSH
jgi:hypothetical protein